MGLVVDGTRGGVMNALYQQAAAYELPGVEEGAAAFLAGLGVVQGDQTGDLALERTCTYQEAMVMADRLILAVYDANDAGSKGLLWKATNGKNILYLLGTIHLDRDNVYPLHKSLRDAIDASQTVSFELDFNDQAGLAEFQALQTYNDGTTLADHVSPELYQRVQAQSEALGMGPNGLDAYKPWGTGFHLQHPEHGRRHHQRQRHGHRPVCECPCGERRQDHRRGGDLRLPGRYL